MPTHIHEINNGNLNIFDNQHVTDSVTAQLTNDLIFVPPPTTPNTPQIIIYENRKIRCYYRVKTVSQYSFNLIMPLSLCYLSTKKMHIKEHFQVNHRTHPTQWTHDAITTSLLRQNDAATSFRRENYVNIASYAPLAKSNTTYDILNNYGPHTIRKKTE